MLAFCCHSIIDGCVHSVNKKQNLHVCRQSFLHKKETTGKHLVPPSIVIQKQIHINIISVSTSSSLWQMLHQRANNNNEISCG